MTQRWNNIIFADMENFFGKSVTNTVKDINVQKRTVIFHASMFGNIDSDDDIIQPGAYIKTIAENGPAGKNRIWHLFNHWHDWPLAKPAVLKEDEVGLYVESTLPDTDKASDILKLYESGFLTEHSVWIRIIKSMDQNNDSKTIRIIQEVALMEVSSVLWGANEQAQTLGLKSIVELDRRIRAGTDLMRNGTLTDESFKRLESELQQIKALLEMQPRKQQEEPDRVSPTTLEAIQRIKNKLNNF